VGESDLASFQDRAENPALRLNEEIRVHLPEMEYIFHDTEKELPETYEYLARLEAILGKPVTRTSPTDSFDHWLAVYGGMLPSNHRRWCTRMKVKAVRELRRR